LQTLCELCGLWQHDICYGLHKYRPQEKPNEHFCYSCLLLPRAEVVNEEMSAVVRMRLALTHIQDNQVQIIEKDSLMKAARECAHHCLHLAFHSLTKSLSDQIWRPTTKQHIGNWSPGCNMRDLFRRALGIGRSLSSTKRGRPQMLGQITLIHLHTSPTTYVQADPYKSR
jgi:hypothetical protein